ncbi:MAG TPA: hypothetical protein VHB73_07645 [Alphaproteobacteria bacterium]|nr:hypothetical protein [Alphaproteobacteria bacterium]
MKPQSFPKAYVKKRTDGRYDVVRGMTGGGTGNVADQPLHTSMPSHEFAVAMAQLENGRINSIPRHLRRRHRTVTLG